MYRARPGARARRRDRRAVMPWHPRAGAAGPRRGHSCRVLFLVPPRPQARIETSHDLGPGGIHVIGAGSHAGSGIDVGLPDVFGEVGEVTPGRGKVVAIDIEPIGGPARERRRAGHRVQVRRRPQISGDAFEGEDVEQVFANARVDITGGRVFGRHETVVAPPSAGVTRYHRIHLPQVSVPHRCVPEPLHRDRANVTRPPGSGASGLVMRSCGGRVVCPGGRIARSALWCAARIHRLVANGVRLGPDGR
jgi:hypothetical protein